MFMISSVTNKFVVKQIYNKQYDVLLVLQQVGDLLWN